MKFNYDIELINLEDSKNPNKINTFDYILTNDFSQYSNNLLINELENDKDFDCKKLMKNNTKIASYCIMKTNLFEKAGFLALKSWQIENRKIYILKKVIK